VANPSVRSGSKGPLAPGQAALKRATVSSRS
jgi:hypothetical protein